MAMHNPNIAVGDEMKCASRRGSGGSVQRGHVRARIHHHDDALLLYQGKGYEKS